MAGVKRHASCVLNDLKPPEVTWSVRGNAPGLFESTANGRRWKRRRGTFSVPAEFVELAKTAILHRNPERFAMLYRLLWRLRGNHDLLDVATDPDVAQVRAMAKAVRRDEHKMHAFVRFREVGRERKSHYVAWFEPEHHIVELAAPFFARRFADMAWSILTPEAARIGTGTPSRSRRACPRPRRRPRTGSRKPGGAITPASSTRPG